MAFPEQLEAHSQPRLHGEAGTALFKGDACSDRWDMCNPFLSHLQASRAWCFLPWLLLQGPGVPIHKCFRARGQVEPSQGVGQLQVSQGQPLGRETEPVPEPCLPRSPACPRAACPASALLCQMGSK